MPQENFAEVLLRTGKLAEAKTEGKTLFPATEGKPAGMVDMHITYSGRRNDVNPLAVPGFLHEMVIKLMLS